MRMSDWSSDVCSSDRQKAALNLANWHHFMDALKLAGYRSEKMISPGTTVIFSYVLYLIGLRDYGVDRVTIRQTITEFFFIATLPGRYTRSHETRFESDLSLLRALPDRVAFLGRLRGILTTPQTGYYWTNIIHTKL